MSENGEQKNNGGFKLLAIRPLKGCDAQFRKNLKEGVVYKFYQDYKFLDSAGNEILESNNNLEKDIATVKAPKEELDLYSDGDLKINLSVVIGENGSGKSTLIDLLCALAFMIFKKSSAITDTKRRLRIDKKHHSSVCNEALNRFKKGTKSDFTYFPDNHKKWYDLADRKLKYLVGKNSSLLDEFDNLKCEFFYELTHYKTKSTKLINPIFRAKLSGNKIEFHLLKSNNWEDENLKDILPPILFEPYRTKNKQMMLLLLLLLFSLIPCVIIELSFHLQTSPSPHHPQKLFIPHQFSLKILHHLRRTPLHTKMAIRSFVQSVFFGIVSHGADFFPEFRFPFTFFG